jgi:hypothetical protein
VKHRGIQIGGAGRVFIGRLYDAAANPGNN